MEPIYYNPEAEVKAAIDTAFEDGYVIGVKKRIKKIKLEIAAEMLEDGIAIDAISKATELSEEEVYALLPSKSQGIN